MIDIMEMRWNWVGDFRGILLKDTTLVPEEISIRYR